jgi:hypothetical protein
MTSTNLTRFAAAVVLSIFVAPTARLPVDGGAPRCRHLGASSFVRALLRTSRSPRKASAGADQRACSLPHAGEVGH